MHTLRGEALEAVDDLDVVGAEDESLLVAVTGGPRKLPAILAAVAGAGGEVAEATLSQPSLESLFITLTGRELRE